MTTAESAPENATVTPAPAEPTTWRRILPSLTGLRAIGAGIVFAFHSIVEINLFAGVPGLLLAVVLSIVGTVCLTGFFILSGFVITWAARPGASPVTFWRNRLVRLYPVHFVTTIGAIALVLGFGGTVTAPEIINNLLLVQTWKFGDPTMATSLNAVSWFLAVEAFCYLCFPGLLWLLNRLRPERLWTALGVVTALSFIIPIAVDLLLPNTPYVGNGPKASALQIWIVYFFPPVRLLEFIAGMLLARIVLTGRWPAWRMRTGVLLFIGGCVLTLVIPSDPLRAGAPTAILAAPIIAILATRDARNQVSGLGGRVWLWFGELSMVIYLVHRLVIQYGYRAIGSPHLNPLVAIVFWLALAAVTLGLSWLLYRFVETPIARRFHTRRRAAEPAAPS
ncbi:acyltransferase family protein [Dactylosporangium sp. CA-092794]|uniref:acyltransferase family protein n=1 Tax=Dactylosporangium sp. CA-092794 TaxID=3239929 RepID=UPI003D8A0233